MESVFNKVKDIKWVWFWSGNWPFLDALTERDKKFEIMFREFVGFNPELSFDIFQNGTITAYHSVEEYSRLERLFMRLYKQDPKFILNSLKTYELKSNHDINSIKMIVGADLRKLSHASLARKFLQLRKHFAYNSTMDHYAWYLEKFFTPVLEDYLKKKLDRLGNTRNFAHLLNTLLTPRKPSKIALERKDFLKILTKVSGMSHFKVVDGRSIKYYKNQYPAVSRLVSSHIRRYGWLQVLVNNPPMSEDDLWNELLETIKSSGNFRSEVKRLGDIWSSRIMKNKSKLIKELNPEKKFKSLIRSLERVAYIRTEDNATTSLMSFLVIPLYKEIGRRLGISYYQLKEIMPQEVTKFLTSDSKNIKKIISDRQKLTVHVVLKGKRWTFTGLKAMRLKNVVEDVKLTYAIKLRKVQGVPASLGIARGRIKVVKSSKELINFEKGLMLVAPATSADFVPAMRLASAIVTDFGGLTSHAAVVSREFGIPCIVGTKVATKVLKDGDFVEVNANSGIVRIIKKQSKK